jgi:hypothetical protein
MDGAGKKLWVYDKANNVWVPLQSDANGIVKVDLSAVNLDDLGDVSVPTPGDQYLLYWDAATSLWKCRALAATDIPNLDAAKITTGRFIAARLPDGTAGYFLKAAGAGLDPAYAALAASDIASGRLLLARLPDGASGYFLKAAGAGLDPGYVLLAAADIPSLDTAKITSGRFIAARMPDGTSGYFLKAAGAGIDPAYAALAAGDIPNLDTSKITSGRFIAARLLDGTSGYFLKAAGAGIDPSYAALAAGDIPNLDTSKITSGILSPARVGPKIQDADADTSWDVEQSADEDKVHGKVKGVEAFLLDDAGVLTLAKQSACRAYRATSAQNIPKTTWTKVQLNAEDFDIQGEFDSTTNYRFTAKTAGIYVGGAAAVISIAADGALLGISIYKNGQAATDNYTTPGATGDAGVGTPFAIQLAVNDYLEMYVYQGSSGSLNLAYGSRLTWFFVAKVS